MRKLFSILTLCAALSGSGCDLFSPQDVTLTDGQVALIASKVGDLNEANQEAWIRETSALLNDTATKVQKTADGLVVTLVPAVTQAAKENQTVSMAGIPEPYGTLVTLIVGALGTASGSIAIKKRRESQTKKAAAKVPA